MFKELCYTLLITLLLFACDSKSDLVAYNEVKIAGDWNQEDTLRLALTPTDKESNDLYLEVTHSQDFNYENIYLKYILSQQGKVLSEEIVSVPLMSEDGLWTGDRQGNNYSNIQLLGSYDLSQPITVEVQQHSRDTKLGGVVAIGVGLL